MQEAWIWAGSNAIRLDGINANATQALAGNGFVKAWAEINADGTVLQCYLCNPNPAETNRIAGFGPGIYEVSFSLLAADISLRPRSANMDGHDFSSPFGEISMADRAGDAASVFVVTADPDGTPADKPYTIFIY